MTLIISCCVTALIIGFAVYRLMKPQIVQTQERNEEVAQANRQLDKEHSDLTYSIQRLQDKYNTLQEAYDRLTTATFNAQSNLTQLNQHLAEAQETAEQTANNFYEAQMKVIREKLEAVVALESDAAEKKRIAIRQEIDTFEQQVNEEKLDIQQALDKMKNAYAAAMDEVRRKEEMENKLDYYRVQISDEDKCEIQALMSIEHLLKNKRNLYMLIWTSYYSKAVNELAARVLGNEVITGIYKITNINTQQVYIGQAKNVKERWREHCKAGGANIDRPTTNKFYQNMWQSGITNFTFELLEACSAKDLDEKEAYWIDFYSANVYGYNSTRGNINKEK